MGAVLSHCTKKLGETSIRLDNGLSPHIYDYYEDIPLSQNVLYLYAAMMARDVLHFKTAAQIISELEALKTSEEVQQSLELRNNSYNHIMEHIQKRKRIDQAEFGKEAEQLVQTYVQTWRKVLDYAQKRLYRLPTRLFKQSAAYTTDVLQKIINYFKSLLPQPQTM